MTLIGSSDPSKIGIWEVEKKEKTRKEEKIWCMGETCRQLTMRGYSEWYADIDYEQLDMLGGGFD
ncbi:hypothetical protein I7I53_05383 [Histoplasma capsulatum var. duboisii H88]|uniref:Uncharacterized protein n=1 Tax=Ajellomyces capsulatus (strain H88) TaxID=544711 RepID=A0A8A1LX58_AJEC8|nr:hypothetical protein I7I53_05383 [Histoplasma capsulatum var. duboisii H88]